MDQATAQNFQPADHTANGVAANGIPVPLMPEVPKTVLDVLLKNNLISRDIYDQINLESVSTGLSEEYLIAQKGIISDDNLSAAKAEFLNVPFIKLSEVGVSPEALSLIPEPVARRYSLIPISIDADNTTLKIGMANPLDLKAISFVEKKTGYNISPCMVSKSELKEALEQRYAQSLTSEVSAVLKDTEKVSRNVIDIKQLGEVIREAPIAKIVETVLSFALKSRASDIHIEPQEDKTRIRYRIDGILHEKLILPVKAHEALVSRIKILSRLKIDEKRIPQDGRFNFRAGQEEVDLRVSTLPTVNGEKVVMRLLKKSGKVPLLTELGLRGMALKHLQTSIVVPHGIILITGPTGSGKTTTLYSILNQINTPKVNIMTLEDPVEYQIGGINQVQINTQVGLTFASGLRSFLRQDPNIIMVGEIRDKETAELAVQASLTGHLVFSTLHTNSAAGALPRLLDMEAEPFLLASSITCIVAQRVARTICEHCKEEIVPSGEVIADFKRVLGNLFDGWLKQKNITENQVVLYQGKGCQECNETGYHGRMGIYEVMPMTEKLSRLILERRPAIDLEKTALEEGMLLMKQDGYLKVLEGFSTIEEVLRVAEI